VIAWWLDLQQLMQPVSLNPALGEVHSIKYNVITFVSDFFSGFLHQ